MSAIVSALDNATFKRHGENAHVEYGWSHNLKEKIVQFFFQLVRTKGNGMEDLKKAQWYLNKLIEVYKETHK